jgi:hypothetical protein
MVVLETQSITYIVQSITYIVQSITYIDLLQPLPALTYKTLKNSTKP